MSTNTYLTNLRDLGRRWRDEKLTPRMDNDDYVAACARKQCGHELMLVLNQAEHAIAALPANPQAAPVIGPEWQPCRKRPVVVHVREQRPGEQHVSTREGITPVKPDDLIMRGVEGEEYPIGRDLFARTYDLVTDEPATPQAAQVAEAKPVPAASSTFPVYEGDWFIPLGAGTTRVCSATYAKGWNECRAAMLAAAQAQAAQVPEGYALVPVEPTPEMVKAGRVFGNSSNEAATIWQSMVIAAARAQGVANG